MCNLIIKLFQIIAGLVFVLPNRSGNRPDFSFIFPDTVPKNPPFLQNLHMTHLRPVSDHHINSSEQKNRSQINSKQIKGVPVRYQKIYAAGNCQKAD